MADTGAVTEARAPVTNGPGEARGGRGDGLYWVVLLACVTVVVVFDVLNVVDERARVGRPISFWEPAVWEVSSALVLLALAPAVLWLIRRTLLAGPLSWRSFAPHLPAAVAFSFVHVAAMGLLRTAAYQLADARYPAFGPLSNWPYELRKDLIVYAVLAATYWVWRRLFAQPAEPGASAEPPVLEVRDGARRHLIPIADIAWVEAAGNYVEVHVAAKSVLHRAPLSRIEQELAGAGLVRIHRSRLVNRAQVAEIESKPSGDFDVVLRDGARLAGSRRYRAGLG